MKYLVFKDVLADWNAENITDEFQENALKLQEQADSNIETAIELTKKGNTSSKEEEKFDNLLKANAYELLALQNQKKTFDIYAGKTPVKTKEKLASIPKVSEKPVSIVKDAVIAVPEEKELSGKLVYKIQISVFSKPVQPDYFKGLPSITTEKISNSNITRYFTGLFKTHKAAQSALGNVRNRGFSDAYIVAYYEGKKVSLNRAKNLENK